MHIERAVGGSKTARAHQREAAKKPLQQGMGAVYVHAIAHAAADQKDNI